MRLKSYLLATAIAGFLISAPLVARAQDAVGAGSSMLAPLMERWAEMAKTQIQVAAAYEGIGSGHGHNKIFAREIDFSISDSPASVETLSTANLIQFPVAIGAIVCVVNIPGLASNKLKLDGKLLAAIYTGKIKNWNDPAIKASNPDVKLPDLAIRPIWQQDPAGPSYAFTQYLLATNADWREKYGTAVKNKRWAVGSAVASNPAMYEVAQQIQGSIGYVDYDLARQAKLPLALLQNGAGNFAPADAAHFAKALASVKWKDSPDLVVNLINLPGDESWPLLTQLYVQMPADPKDKARSDAVIKFFEFAAYGGGRSAVRGRHLVAMPQDAHSVMLAVVAKIGAL